MRNVGVVAVLSALTLVVGCGGSKGTSGQSDASAPDGGPGSGVDGGPSDAGSESGVASESGVEGEAGAQTWHDCASPCPSGYVCGFLESAGCSAIGICVPLGADCDIATGDFCSCAGTSIFTMCGTNGLPEGYQTAPFAHAGACEADSGD
jgi:hypothetical protein